MIHVSENSELEEVFGDKDVADVMDHKEITLPRLNSMLLCQLPSLSKFCPVGYHFIFPSLSDGTLIINRCPKMSTRFSLGEDGCVHAKAKKFVQIESTILWENPVLFNLICLLLLYLHNAIYDCGELEEIIAEEDEENQILFFQNLLHIHVQCCPKIRRLFAITVAPRLQKLEGIFAFANYELEEVFGDKDVADVMDHKEIELPQLDSLYLCALPSLTKFFPVGYHFVFPTLKDSLTIGNCPKMSTRFSMGEDGCVHAKAKALKMGSQDQIAEFPSEPSIDIIRWGFDVIKESLPLYIENDDQSIKQKEEEINTET
ncbi:hypothetical protein Pint_04129 [Pistacia integerrima]|uniref:Uncharacterized protein n=1 Tax=Pistacia integerrima TaxID=434235 RepID=A0ACC0Z952_9ROSI|nr:hypothetical protein Pint_04129 [Pistacia integerrima]